MAHQWARCNLLGTNFPLLTQLQGQTVILRQIDQNFPETDILKDSQNPSSYYMHNCVPTARGLQAVGYTTQVAALAGAMDFDRAYPLQNATLNRFVYVPSAGKNYIYDRVVGIWTSISPLTPGTVPDNVLVTTAFIQGQTYIYIAAVGCFVYNEVTHVMDAVAFTGLAMANVLGICAANGYMLAFNATQVAWSSATTPTDFTPSIVTGAGGANIADAEGAITVCYSVVGGFIVYCEKNAVGATYSGVFQQPFFFKEIAGSGGSYTPEAISWQANLDYHYAYTTAGLQAVSLASSIFVFPEVTEFIAGKIYEDFSETSLTFTSTDINLPLNVKITVIESSYLIISYGVNAGLYTYALYFDINLKRWGKLKIDHVDCFQWNSPNLFGALTYDQLAMSYDELATVTYTELGTTIVTPELPRTSLAFLQQDGTVKTVDFKISETGANGVLLLGKYQLVRNKAIEHQRTQVESVRNSANFNMYLLATLDGKTFLPVVTPSLIENSGLTRTYARWLYGKNISLLFTGAFNFSNIEVDFTLGGTI